MSLIFGNKEVGEDFPAFIIAEIGSNHNQDLNLAFEMIESAKENGADAVKFQSLNVDELYFNPPQDVVDLHKKIDLIESWHRDLKNFCDKKKILFFSAPTYFRAVDILEELGVDFYKLASAQVGTFPQIVKKVAKTKKPIILSGGISTFKDLEKTVKIIREFHNDFAILHCNSIYPVPYEKVNLKMIEVYKSMFGNVVGFSDHTDDIFASIGAVSLGAKIIERHFTIDKKLPVPDAEISILPETFKRMVQGIRAVEQSFLKRDRTSLEFEEKEFKEEILYRLILKVDKKAGEKFSKDDFAYKRHHFGVDCRDEGLILTKMVANRDLKKGELLEWKFLRGF